MSEAKPAILVIGGLDPQGCAGIAVDIQTIQHHGAHAVPLVTCLTEQSSQGLSRLGALSPEQFMAQYRSCVADFELSAIKVGLIPNLAIAHCIETIIEQHTVPVVVDPVLAATSGGSHVDADLIQFIATRLVKKIQFLTPNLPELALLTDQHCDDDNFIEVASQTLIERGLTSCLVTGGHSNNQWAADYFISETTPFYCYQQKQAQSVRATGCCLASSLAAHLAFGQDPRDAVILAKAYVSRAIRTSQKIGPYAVLSHSSDPVQLQDMPKLCYQAKLIGHEIHFPPCAEKLGIYPVVDHVNWVDKLAKEGVQTLQLRLKEISEKERVSQIRDAIKIANSEQNVALFINDYWQDAIDENAYGVHLGQEDLHDAKLESIAKAGLRLGVSTHSYWELARALAINPSYIALGPIFETTSKQMPFSPQGMERLALWVVMLEDHYPLVAIGGIDLERAKKLKSTGVGSIAMISVITKANDYQQVTQELLHYWND